MQRAMPILIALLTQACGQELIYIERFVPFDQVGLAFALDNGSEPLGAINEDATANEDPLALYPPDRNGVNVTNILESETLFVDTTQGLCQDDEGACYPEAYGPHFAWVTVRNDGLPDPATPAAGLETITEYSVRFFPISQGRPDLPPFTGNIRATSTPGTVTTLSLVLIPREVKIAFATESSFPDGTYVAEIELSGVNQLKLQARSTVTFGDFGRCFDGTLPIPASASTSCIN